MYLLNSLSVPFGNKPKYINTKIKTKSNPKTTFKIQVNKYQNVLLLLKMFFMLTCTNHNVLWSLHVVA